MEGKMYRKEKRILVTMLSLILIPGFYALYIYYNYVAGNPQIINDFSFWGKSMLILVPVMVIAMILIHIVFAIINKIVTNEDMPVISDEMDKLIELKALRISHWTYSIGFLFSMASQAAGMQSWVMFVVLISSCFAGGITQSITQIYFYRKGI